MELSRRNFLTGLTGILAASAAPAVLSSGVNSLRNDLFVDKYGNIVFADGQWVRDPMGSLVMPWSEYPNYIMAKTKVLTEL